MRTLILIGSDIQIFLCWVKYTGIVSIPCDFTLNVELSVQLVQDKKKAIKLVVVKTTKWSIITKTGHLVGMFNVSIMFSCLTKMWWFDMIGDSPKERIYEPCGQVVDAFQLFC